MFSSICLSGAANVPGRCGLPGTFQVAVHLQPNGTWALLLSRRLAWKTFLRDASLPAWSHSQGGGLQGPYTTGATARLSASESERGWSGYFYFLLRASGKGGGTLHRVILQKGGKKKKSDSIERLSCLLSALFLLFPSTFQECPFSPRNRRLRGTVRLITFLDIFIIYHQLTPPG